MPYTWRQLGQPRELEKEVSGKKWPKQFAQFNAKSSDAKAYFNDSPIDENNSSD
jgi:hypothetical protein